MAKVTDEQILRFAEENNCTDVVVTRPKDKRGKSIIYVSYNCACGKENGTKWRRFVKNPRCKLCCNKINPRIDDDIIIQKVNSLGHEFISIDKQNIKGRLRIFVNFICKCDKETERKNKRVYWDAIQSDGGCSDCANLRRKESNIKTHKERGTEIQEKIVKTNIERFGVPRAMQNTEIFNKAIKNSYKLKEYTFPSGNKIKCQGFEPQAIDILLSEGIQEDDIWIDDQITMCKAFPKFTYEIDGIQHRYYPDIYIASEDKFIEVKSEWTLNKHLERVKIKAEAVKKFGYEIEIWVISHRDGSLLYKL